MSTNTTETTTATVTIKVTPALVKSVKEICDLQSKLEGKFQAGADACREAAKSLGYDRKQAREMLTLAFKEAGQDVIRKAPDISKILSLAYPASDESAKALADAKAHNQSAAPDQKIGVNDQLRIARDKEGKTTVETILRERAEKKTGAREARPGGNANPANATGAKETPAQVKERAIKAITHAYTELRATARMSEEEIDSAFAEIVAEFNSAAGK